MHGYTTHNHACCAKASPSQWRGSTPLTRCGGPRNCNACVRDADSLHAQSGIAYESADGTPLAPEEIQEIERQGAMDQLLAEIKRQEEIHPVGFPATRDGLRLGLAALEDELEEARDEWRANRRTEGWGGLRMELMQIAAVALRMVRSLDG